MHALTAIEAALLHLMGRFLDVPVTALLGDGVQRRTVPVLGYLHRRPAQDRASVRGAAGGRGRLAAVRHEETLTPDAIVRRAEAARERYRFADFKLKGGVFRGDEEADAVRALAERFPGARINLDPNGAWSVLPPRQCTGGPPRLPRRSVRRAERGYSRRARRWRSSAAPPPRT